MAHLHRLVTGALRGRQNLHIFHIKSYTPTKAYNTTPISPLIPTIAKHPPKKKDMDLSRKPTAGQRDMDVIYTIPSYPGYRDPISVLPYPNATFEIFQCLYDLLLFPEIRSIFWAFEVTKTDFIKALMDPSLSLALESSLQRRQADISDNERKLSTNDILRLLKVNLYQERDPPFLRVKDLLAFNRYIKKNGDPDDCVAEMPLDFLDVQEDEYVLAERKRVRDPNEVPLFSLVEPLTSFLLGKSARLVRKNDPIMAECVYLRNLKTKKISLHPDYEQQLEDSMEAYIKKREEIESDVIISGPYMFRKPPKD